MTRHSLGYLLSERAKAQKQFIPISVELNKLETNKQPLQTDTITETMDIVKQDKTDIVIIDEKLKSETNPNNEKEEKYTIHNPEHPTRQ